MEPSFSNPYAESFEDQMANGMESSPPEASDSGKSFCWFPVNSNEKQLHSQIGMIYKYFYIFLHYIYIDIF